MPAREGTGFPKTATRTLAGTAGFVQAVGPETEGTLPRKNGVGFLRHAHGMNHGVSVLACLPQIRPAYLRCGLGGLLTAVRFPCCLFPRRCLNTPFLDDTTLPFLDQHIQGLGLVALDVSAKIPRSAA